VKVSQGDILGSMKSIRWTAYCYNNADLISKFPKIYPAKKLKIAVVDNPTVVWRLLPGEPLRISALYCQKLESMVYILPLIVWVYLHSMFRGGLRSTHLFCNRVRIGCLRSYKVVDFGTNRKGVCDFLLVINSNFDPILRSRDPSLRRFDKIPACDGRTDRHPHRS